MMKENFNFEKEEEYNWQDSPELIGPISGFLGVLLPEKRDTPLNILKVESVYDGDKIVKIHAVIDSEIRIKGKRANIDFYLEDDMLETFKRQNNIK